MVFTKACLLFVNFTAYFIHDKKNIKRPEMFAAQMMPRWRLCSRRFNHFLIVVFIRAGLRRWISNENDEKDGWNVRYTAFYGSSLVQPRSQLCLPKPTNLLNQKTYSFFRRNTWWVTHILLFVIIWFKSHLSENFKFYLSKLVGTDGTQKYFLL